MESGWGTHLFPICTGNSCIPFPTAAVLGYILASPGTWLVWWALCLPSSLGTAELQIPRVENPWAEVTQCESGWVSMALARGAGGEASGEVSTTSSAAARSSQELSGGMFPMTAIPTLLVFPFLWTFPCTQSFLKESQEEGNVPVVTLAVIAPGWMSQAAKSCPGKEGPQQLLELLSWCHPVLCSPQSQRTHFIGAKSVIMNLLILKILILVVTLLTPPPCSSSCLCGEDRASPPMQVQGGTQDFRGTPSNRGNPSCGCTRVSRSGSGRGGRLEVRGGSGF